MFSLGDAVILGSAILSGGGVGVTAICKFKKNGNNTNGHITKELCEERSGSLKDDISEIKVILDKVFIEIKEVRKDVSKQT